MSSNPPTKNFVKFCALCGRRFYAHFEDTEYCSSSCYVRAKELAAMKERDANPKCLFCGKPFVRNSSRKKVYCSEACAEKAYKARKRERRKQLAIQVQVEELQRKALERERAEREREKEKKKKKGDGKRVLRYCSLCGEPFRTANAERKHCSLCLLHLAKAKKEAEERGDVRTVVCDICGEEFKTADTEMRICPECSARSPHSVDYQRHMRKCHDCGCQTTQYRCSRCWEKWRRKYGIPLDGGGMHEEEE